MDWLSLSDNGQKDSQHAFPNEKALADVLGHKHNSVSRIDSSGQQPYDPTQANGGTATDYGSGTGTMPGYTGASTTPGYGGTDTSGQPIAPTDTAGAQSNNSGYWNNYGGAPNPSDVPGTYPTVGTNGGAPWNSGASNPGDYTGGANGAATGPMDQGQNGNAPQQYPSDQSGGTVGSMAGAAGDQTAGSAANNTVPMDHTPQQTAPSAAGDGLSSGSSSHGPSIIGWGLERGATYFGQRKISNYFLNKYAAREAGTAAAEASTVEAGTPLSSKLLSSDGVLSYDAYKAGLGKAFLGGFLIDTAMDRTIFSHKGSSWKTMAVDLAAPIASAVVLDKTGSFGKALATMVLPHAIEKMLFE